MTLDDGRRVLAIVPVRSGSRRILGKNLRMFNGKELFRWTLEAALESGYIDSVVISTDSKDVINITDSYGRGMCFLRSGRTSEDYSTSDDVITEVLNEFGSKFEVIIYLQPTSPLRGVSQIDESLSIFEKGNTPVVSVTKNQNNPLWTLLVDENGFLCPLAPQYLSMRSQDLPPTYSLNGAIYIAEIDQYIQSHTFLTNDAAAFVMKPEHSVDIDDEKDFEEAEEILRSHHN